MTKIEKLLILLINFAIELNDTIFYFNLFIHALVNKISWI